LLCSGGPHYAAQAAAPDEASSAETQSVSVSGTKDPDWKPYKKMLDGLNAFDQYHALAPAASLKFLLRPQKPDLSVTDLNLRIVSDTISINVPIEADYTFSVPRDEAAAKEDADFRLNSKKGLFRWRPDIHTPGLPANTRRLGDLRLECEVRWAVDKFDLSFLQLAYLTTLGGACHTSRSRIFFNTPKPFLSATLVSGERRQKIDGNNLDAKDRSRYAPPIHDSDWPNETLVEFEFAD